MQSLYYSIAKAVQEQNKTYIRCYGLYHNHELLIAKEKPCIIPKLGTVYKFHVINRDGFTVVNVRLCPWMSRDNYCSILGSIHTK